MPVNKVNQSYSVVSYFCGCGGLDLGFCGDFRYRDENYEKLPFNIEIAYDKEQRCVETYNGYFGEHASTR
jgi:DNA (cytosine-5)-methyltransferase 1